MSVIDQGIALAQSYVWLPGLLFVFLVAGVYWLSRPTPQLAVEPGGGEVKLQTADLSSKKAPEQRVAFRRQGNPIEVLVTIREQDEESRIGSVLDRSVGGMRLALFHEIEIGKMISIRPTHADEMVPWIELEVKSCRPSAEMPGHFDVGCQYVKSPPYSIQLLFG